MESGNDRMQDRLEALAFKIKTRSIQLVRLLVYGLLCGTLVGAVASVFALGIDAATQLRGSHPWVIFLMPVGAALIIFFYQKFDHSEGTDTVLLAVTRSRSSSAPRSFPIFWEHLSDVKARPCRSGVVWAMNWANTSTFRRARAGSWSWPA